jgi:predicted secreted protein
LSRKTKEQLIRELKTVLDQPNDIKLQEMIIAAEMRSHLAVRRVLGLTASPLFEPELLGRFRELRQKTGETGDVWRQRVRRILDGARDRTYPTERDDMEALVALVEPMVTG